MCYDCVEGYEKGCEPLDEALAEKNFLRDCQKDPPEQVKERKDFKAVGCRKIEQEMNIAGTIEVISYWEIDYDMPILKGENRNYIEDIIYHTKE